MIGRSVEGEPSVQWQASACVASALQLDVLGLLGLGHMLPTTCTLLGRAQTLLQPPGTQLSTYPLPA